MNRIIIYLYFVAQSVFWKIKIKIKLKLDASLQRRQRRIRRLNSIPASRWDQFHLHLISAPHPLLSDSRAGADSHVHPFIRSSEILGRNLRPRHKCRTLPPPPPPASGIWADGRVFHVGGAWVTLGDGKLLHFSAESQEPWYSVFTLARLCPKSNVRECLLSMSDFR